MANIGEFFLYSFTVAIIAIVSYVFFWIVISSSTLFVDDEKFDKDKVIKRFKTIGIVYCFVFELVAMLYYTRVLK